MPAAWQDLAAVDREIIKDFESDRKALHCFMSWLSEQRSFVRRNFIERHPDLCQGIVLILNRDEKRTFRRAVESIGNRLYRAKGSNVFWIDSERAALPTRWQLAAQEGRLLAHIQTNEKDFQRLLHGLLTRGKTLVLDYPNVAITTLRMATEKNPHDQKLREHYLKIHEIYFERAKQNEAGRHQ